MTEHAVVIAGGGPTGLMLAGELALAGVDIGPPQVPAVNVRTGVLKTSDVGVPATTVKLPVPVTVPWVAVTCAAPAIVAVT